MEELDEMWKLSSMHHEIDQLIAELKDEYSCYSVEDQDTFRQYMKERLEEEFSHPHDKAWIHEGNGPWDNSLTCPKCGFKVLLPESYEVQYKYCPLCGRKNS